MSVDLKKAHAVSTFKHTEGLMGCCFDAEAKFVFAGGRDFSVVRFAVEGGAKTVMTGHKSWVRGMAYAAPAKVLVTGDYQGQLIWWDALAEKPTARQTIAAHTGWVRAVAVSPDGQTIASCGNDHLVKLWSAADGKPLATLVGHDCHVYHVAFHPDGKSLASGDHKGVVKHWNLATGSVQRDMTTPVLTKYDPTFKADIGGVRGMSFDSAGQLLACAGITDVTNAFAGIGKPAVVVFDWVAGKQKTVLRGGDDPTTAWGVAFHPDGFLIGVGSGRRGAGSVWFWQPDKPAAVHSLAKQPSARDVALSHDGQLFATASVEGTVSVYGFTDPPAPATPEKKTAGKKK